MKNRFVATLTTLAMTLALAPVSWAAGSAPSQSLPRQIKGQVKQKCGQALESGLSVRLVDGQGNPAPGMTVPVASDGTFVFNDVPTGMFTVQAIRTEDRSVEGMSALTVATGSVLNTIVTIGTGKCGFWLWKNKTAMLLIGAAAAGTTVGIIATRKEASPSR